MQVDYLIIGQGISGTWLSYFLQQAKQSFFVIDNKEKNAASRIAAGIINPITGRRHVEVWMADEIIPFAFQEYKKLGEQLGITAISQKNIIDFFPSPQMRISFAQRVEESNKHVKLIDGNNCDNFFNSPFGSGEVSPVYTAHLETILPAWHHQLQQLGLISKEEFEITHLKYDSKNIQYKEITARKIIFCDGNAGASNPFFSALPYAPNKGEALVLSIPDLPRENIYKQGMMLVPLNAPDEWWIGSNYAWSFDNTLPTTQFSEKTIATLNQWLKLPYTVVKHLVGIRPATLERRPFVGLHPLHPAIGILNGMGTKGCSLAPYFANQLVNHLVSEIPLSPEADIKRFTRILSR